jgi:alpha-tubulin suppressor-like RCC1 family protein
MTWISGPAVKTLFVALALTTLGLAGVIAPAKADVAFKPSAPLHVVTTQEAPTDTSIYVSWTAPVSDGGASISDYTVQYRSQSANSWSTFSHDASTATSIRVTGLSSGSIYMFRVAAVNSVGTGLWSAQESTISTGHSHACAQMENGTVKCWGRSSYGQLGDGTVSYSNIITPITVPSITGLTDDSKVVSLNLGEYHSCAVMRDGSVQCWGYNNEGQLGDGTRVNKSVPTVVPVIDHSTPAKTAVSISAGIAHTCAVMGDGSVLCWGNNNYGQLGDNSTTRRLTPVAVSGLDGSSAHSTAVSVSAGDLATCALMADGTSRCWGLNGYRWLGNQSGDDSSVPVDQSGGFDGSTDDSTGLSVSTSSDWRVCVLMESGAAKCWGSNAFGGLGIGSSNDDLHTEVLGAVNEITGATAATTAVSVSGDDTHGCAALAVGTVKCWGRGTAGQLGNDFWTDERGPVLALGGIDGTTAASTAVNVSAGLYFTCSAMADGSARCWGVNDNGQLGSDSGFEMSLYVPTAVNGINGSTNSTRVAIGAVGRTTGSSLVAPGAPGRPVIGARTTSSVRISWTAAASNGSAITNYLVEYRKGTGSWSPFTRADSTALSTTVTGLTKGGSYTFRVSAVSAGGTSAASVVSAAALAASAPGVPGSVAGKATKVAGQIAVTWTAAALNGAPSATYKVSWLVGGKWTTPVAASGFAYTITKLRPGTYSVKVIATTVEGSMSATKAGIVLKK